MHKFFFLDNTTNFVLNFSFVETHPPSPWMSITIYKRLFLPEKMTNYKISTVVSHKHEFLRERGRERQREGEKETERERGRERETERERGRERETDRERETYRDTQKQRSEDRRKRERDRERERERQR